MHKKATVLSTVMIVCTFASTHLIAAQNRYIIIHNELSQTIYPVIESPDDGNCKPKATTVKRIVVPEGVKNGETIKVYLPDSCWYNAGRTFIFTPNIEAFESFLDKKQQTQKGAHAECYALDQNKNQGASVSCYQGTAEASYPLDSPAQLTEFTFDADDPVTGKPSVNPNTGRLMTDIDISYVDQTFLPVAMAIDTGGIAGYMGTTMSYDMFVPRVNHFLKQANWSSFAAYTKENWPNNVFHDLIPFSYHTMGGYNLFNAVNSKATSSLYKVVNPKEGDYAFLIENLVNDYPPSNPSVTAIAAKWKAWLAPNNPCNDKAYLDNPAVDKQGFCEDFQATVQWVWDTYKNFEPEALDVQLIEYINGYTHGPNGGRLPESVQAILRGVPWNEAPKPQYQYDKWILFWAPADSPYSLNAFTHFIHNAGEGLDAAAYSFSIDDKYGNFRDEGTGFIIDVGGANYLPNRSMYDPYQQYFVTWGENSWDHASVGGREVSIYKRPGNARISFWKEGNQQEYCDVILYTTEKSEPHLNFRLREEPKRVVTDTYTGIEHEVRGLETDIQYCQNHSSPELKAYCTQANLSPIYQGDIAYISLPDAQKPKTTLNTAALVVGGRINLAPSWTSAQGCGLPINAHKIDPKKGSSFPLKPGAGTACKVTLTGGTVEVFLSISFDTNGNIIPNKVHCEKSDKQHCSGVFADAHNINLPPANAI